jgi:membrane-bound lytic murein transglycosylase B
MMYAIRFKIGRLFGFAAAFLSAWMLTASAPLHAQGADGGFGAYVQSLWPKAQARGVSRATFDRVTAGLVYNPRVIALDRDNLGSPPSPNTPIPSFAPYKAKHVDAARIGGGRRVHDRLLPLLSRIEARTGVPTSIMIAIYGHETAYGQVTGNFDLPEALATLAYEGRRRSLFEPELIATMVMVERGVPRSALKGSWAGAFGYPQFLPSVYLQVAEDGDGDGVARIWSSEADAIESIGSYLRRGTAVGRRGDRTRGLQPQRGREPPDPHTLSACFRPSQPLALDGRMARRRHPADQRPLARRQCAGDFARTRWPRSHRIFADR